MVFEILAYVQHPSWGSFHNEGTLFSNVELTCALWTRTALTITPSQSQWGLAWSGGGFCRANVFYINCLIGSFQTHGGWGVTVEVHNPSHITSIFRIRLSKQKSYTCSKKDCTHSSGDTSPFLSYFTYPLYHLIYIGIILLSLKTHFELSYIHLAVSSLVILRIFILKTLHLTG